MSDASSTFPGHRRRRLLAASAGLAAAALTPATGRTQAQAAYPNRPVTFICPWAQGGTADRTMRVLAKALSQHLGQEVAVRNMAGASGMIGAHHIATARPDGYTIGQVPVSVVRFAQLGMVTFDPLRDFSFLARTSGQTFGIVVRSDSPYLSIAQMLEEAAAYPGKVTYGSSGVGGASHIGMEEFLDLAGVKMRHLPYKGGAPALRDLLSGQVDVLCDSASWSDSLTAGRVRLLATLGPQRLTAFQQVPTLRDLGFDVVVDAPNGVGAPAGLAPEVKARLREALKKAVWSPEFRVICERTHVPLMYQDAEEYRLYMAAQYETQKRLIEKLRLREHLART